MESLRVPASDTSGDLVKARFLNFLQNFRQTDDAVDFEMTQERQVD